MTVGYHGLHARHECNVGKKDVAWLCLDGFHGCHASMVRQVAIVWMFRFMVFSCIVAICAHMMHSH